MQKVKIKIVKIGVQKHDDVFKKIKKHKSSIFDVDISEIRRPKCDYGWGYSFETLSSLLSKSFEKEKFDICIGFVDTVIENNYFGKRVLDNNIYIISFYEIDKILKAEQINLTNFAITVIYRYITRYIIAGKMLVHDETKGCIFDMCGDKNDVIYFSQRPIICDECSLKLKKYKVSNKYITALKKELTKIRKSKYYVISDFIKSHPYISLSLGILGSLLINIVSNFIYDFFLNFL